VPARVWIDPKCLGLSSTTTTGFFATVLDIFSAECVICDAHVEGGRLSFIRLPTPTLIFWAPAKEEKRLVGFPITAVCQRLCGNRRPTIPSIL